MRELVLHELVIDSSSAWGKWPHTQDTDYSPVIESVSPAAYEQDDLRLVVYRHTYPAHAAYVKVGVLRLPEGMPTWGIDVNLIPPSRVLEQQLADITEYSKTCKAIRWRHAWQCYPIVSKELPALFPIRILEFGDDCPGSSERKTFPNAAYFNELVHNMYTWDFETGTRVAAMYKERGLASTHFAALSAATGTIAYAEQNGLTVEAKAESLRSGAQLPYGLVFVGCAGWLNKRRLGFNTELAKRRAEFAAAGITTRLHGSGCVDGVLEPVNHPNGSGWVTAPLYWNALLGCNYAISSIFNARLFDLWLSGVGQMIYDKNNELADFGAQPDQHYIAYDGTVDDLLRQAIKWSRDRTGLAELIVRGRDKAREIISTWSHDKAFQRIYFKHLQAIEP